MHEVYIAESILETAIWKCRDSGFGQIKNIKVKIGKASVVSTEALIFVFDALKIGSIASEASLIVEEIPTTGCCKTCNGEFSVDRDFIFQCPCCGSDSVIIKSGNGVELAELEVES
ncbi:MAG: hydrogenase maturation nickel metallochaperone HypA [Thermodesulfovibrionales bacterium]|jgi:hydrogenase nickel incorporation protein HypA/HybF|nr:hydrogenase maturation nickel metallochaperone HypA [Thermodesulfovibrionales bacterium]